MFIGISTEQRVEKFLKKLVGRTDLEDALKRLDRLTQEEARMALAEVLRITQCVDGKVQTVDEKVQVVIDGAQCLSSQSPIYPHIYNCRRKRGKSGGKGSKIYYPTDRKQRRRNYVFVIT